MKRFFLLLLPALAGVLAAQSQLRFCVKADPRTLNPLLAEDEVSQTVAYLTNGVLLRIHRGTQQSEPELADSWKIDHSHREIRFHLRRGVRFSDGTPFGPEDVQYTINKAMDPALHSPVGDSFRAYRSVSVRCVEADTVVVRFGEPAADPERLFDGLPILSSRSPHPDKAGLGPFVFDNYRHGVSIDLKRNTLYWKVDSAGKRLPYLERVRLDIQQNSEIELARFRRGEVDLIANMEPELFERLAKEQGGAAREAGPSLDTEQLWFNQSAAADLPDFEKHWFGSRNFRNAVSLAINRSDICRIAYQGRARAASGPISAANRFWFNARLQSIPFDPQRAMELLNRDGFRLRNGSLEDREGRRVEFSLITNSGNRVRARIAALVQQDLQRIGIHLNVVPLEFSSLIERITSSFRYEACLLGLVGGELDPNGQMNVWLSSAENHQWNPNQKSPATAWEAEIDRLMRAQATAATRNQRKALFDRVQEIVREQEPFIYLVNRDALAAVSPRLQNVEPSALSPHVVWNIERIAFRRPDNLTVSRK